MFRKIFGPIFSALDAIDNLVLALVAIVAGVILLIGPPVLVWRWLTQHHYFAAFSVALLWVATLAGIVRDMRSGRFGWITGCALGVWLITTGVLAWNIGY